MRVLIISTFFATLLGSSILLAQYVSYTGKSNDLIAYATELLSTNETSIDNFEELSSAYEPITTNLKTPNTYGSITLGLTATGKDEKELLDEVDHFVQNFAIQEMSGMTKQDFQSKESMRRFTLALKNHLNEVFGREIVQDVYVTGKLLQHSS